MKVGVIDYGVGNLGSVLRALEELRVAPVLVNRAADMHATDCLILPGVGNFDQPERPAAIVATLAEYVAQPDFTQWREPDLSTGPLWEQVDYTAPHPPAVGGRSGRAGRS